MQINPKLEKLLEDMEVYTSDFTSFIENFLVKDNEMKNSYRDSPSTEYVVLEEKDFDEILSLIKHLNPLNKEELLIKYQEVKSKYLLEGLESLPPNSSVNSFYGMVEEDLMKRMKYAGKSIDKINQIWWFMEEKLDFKNKGSKNSSCCTELTDLIWSGHLFLKRFNEFKEKNSISKVRNDLLLIEQNINKKEGN